MRPKAFQRNGSGFADGRSQSHLAVLKYAGKPGKDSGKRPNNHNLRRPRGEVLSTEQSESVTLQSRHSMLGRRYSEYEAVSNVITERVRSTAVVAMLLLLLLAAGCRRGQNKVLEVAYVAAPQVNLRDRVSALYNKTGTVKNGERVEVLERNKRFVRIKSASGETGWIEQRYLVGEDIYRGFEKLAAENRNTPMQARGLARASLKMHITPGRDTDSLIQLKEGDKVEILKRTTIEKPQTAGLQAKPVVPKGKKGKAGPEEPAVPMEDWCLARDEQGHAGWVLARMVGIGITLDLGE